MTGKQARRHHDCAVDECRLGLPRHILMCRPHWRMVPKSMQHDVTATWRRSTALADRPLPNPDRVQAVRDYLVARRAAVDLVNGKVGRE